MVLLIALGACASEEAPSIVSGDAGQGGDVEIRPNVINGEEVTDVGREYPYLVRLNIVTPTNTRSVCTGVIISPNWVLTAAHCLSDERNGVFPASSVGAAEIRLHPQYRTQLGTQAGFDAALVRLRQPILGVPFPMLPDEDKPTTAGTRGQFVGYGLIGDNSPLPENPHQKTLAVQSAQFCRNTGVWPNININNSRDTMLCVEETAPRDRSADLCGGDSGGPLVSRRSNGSDLIVGLLSFGSAGPTGNCENLIPPGSTRRIADVLVDLSEPRVRNWIYDQISPRFLNYQRELRRRNLSAVVPTGPAVGGIALPKIFDEAYYLRSNPDVAAAVRRGAIPSGWNHFVRSGQFEGRNPSILYNERYYLGTNPDVAAAVADGRLRNGLSHFLNSGHRERQGTGRRPSPYFNPAAYLVANPDVAAAVARGAIPSAFSHYVNSGQEEPREPFLSIYGERTYLINNPDVANAVRAGSFPDGYNHYLRFIARNANRTASPLYSEASYLRNNPDVAAAVQRGAISGGFSHYAQNGRFEYRRVF